MKMGMPPFLPLRTVGRFRGRPRGTGGRRIAAVLPALPAAARAEEGLRPIRGPIVPGFWEENWPWAAPAAALAAVGLAVAAYFLFRYLRRPRIPSPLERYRSVAAAVRASLDRGERDEIPTRLSAALREYVEGTTGFRAPGRTSEEFLAAATPSAPEREASALPPDAVRQLEPFLRLADETKFTGRAPGEDECRELLARADRFVDAVEESHPPESE